MVHRCFTKYNGGMLMLTFKQLDDFEFEFLLLGLRVLKPL